MKIKSAFFNDESFSASFFDTQREVYPHLNLQWAKQHDLLSSVTPFAVFDDTNKAVSILNASRMTMNIKGQDFKTLQIGTVATLPDHRGKGLAALLQKHVQETYNSHVDFMFLFANPSVLEFYPKFGFRPIQQVSYSYQQKHAGYQTFSPLDLDESGVHLLKQTLAKRDALSNIIVARDSQWLAEFYCRTFFANNLWIDGEGETILVASVDGATLYIDDVISPKISRDFFSTISWEGISEIRLGFTPDRFKGDFETVPLPVDEHIFVRGSFPDDLGKFKFPALAYT